MSSNLPMSGSPIPGGLDSADEAGQHPQYAPFGAGRHQPGRRRLLVHTAVAGAVRRAEYGRLPVETENGGVHVGLSE